MTTKNFTILSNNETGEIILVPTKDIYPFVKLCTACDGAWIMMSDGTLDTTDEAYFYPTDYFEGSDERLVLRVDELKDKGLEHFGNRPRILAKSDDWDDEPVEVIDVTEDWMSYIAGKAVDIEHGINTDTIAFDLEDGDGWWSSVEEVTAEYEHECNQDYPRQEATYLWHCSNGKTIRERFSFFRDESRNTFEYVDDSADNC